MAGLDIKLTTIEGDDLSAMAEMTGAIDGNTVPNFQATLEEIKTRGIQRLVLDMSKIKYVNSTGLGSLVKYADTFKSSGGGMALIKVPAKVKIVIEMLGLNAFFDICQDLDAALGALKNAGGGAAPAEPKTASGSQKIPRAPTRGMKRAESAASAPSAPSAPAPVQAPAPAAPPASGGSGGFPQTTTCQTCSVQLDLPSAGNWKCPRCYTFVTANADGSVSFNNANKPVPVNLSLTASRECGEGLVHLVTSVCQQSFNGNGPKLEALRLAVHEIATVMCQSVYANNPQGVYHVSVERQPGRVQIRFSDHGASIDAGQTGQFFPNASRSMSEFECRAHPSGGNTIKIVQTA